MQRVVSFLLISGLVFCLGGEAEAKPEFVRLSLIGDTSTSMSIAWTTLTGAAEAVVEYGVTPGQLKQKATGKVNPRISNILGSTSEVTISGLKPDTRYYYRAGGVAGGFSTE